MRDTPLDTVAFAERLLALLEEGVFTATYKFAVLLGLMDLCLEGTTNTGAPPENVTTAQLAQKIVEIYWRQVAAYGKSGRILEQNAGPARDRSATTSAVITRRIAEFRTRSGEGLTMCEAVRQAPRGFSKLLHEVEWTLVKMPLPKLQRFGDADDQFVYTIAWDDEIRRGEWSDLKRFDNRIRFVGEAAAHLVRLSSLLRPLIQQKWAEKVADLNGLKTGCLESFLFDSDRAVLTRVAEPLLWIQGGDCFYCGSRLRESLHVDHFIPWSRHPDDGIDNLVAAHAKCNLAKRSFLAGCDHLRNWMERGRQHAPSLERIAMQAAWPRDSERTLGSVRASYLTVPRGQRLWLEGRRFEPADRSDLAKALL